MKKKRVLVVCVVLAALILVGVLFVPYKVDILEDGGSTVHTAVMYTCVEWKGIDISNPADGIVTIKKSVFWFPTNRKSINELRKIAFPGAK